MGSLIVLDRLDVIAKLDQVLNIKLTRQLGVAVLGDFLILRGILVDGGEKLLGGSLVRFRSGNTILVGITNRDIQFTGGIERRAGLALLVLLLIRETDGVQPTAADADRPANVLVLVGILQVGHRQCAGIEADIAIGRLKQRTDQRGVFGNLDVDALCRDNPRAGGPRLETVLLRAANTPVGGVDANRQAEGKAVPPALSLWREDGEIAPDIKIDRPADDVATQKRRIAAGCQRNIAGGGDGGIRQRLVIALRLADIEADRGQGELQAAS